MATLPPSVVLLDDNPLVLTASRAALEEAGYRVTICPSFAELPALCRRVAADLVVLDVQMPEVEGDVLAASLKRYAGLTVPIVLFSALPVDKLEERARRARAAWVSKRDGVAALVGRVGALLSGASAAGRPREGAR